MAPGLLYAQIEGFEQAFPVLPLTPAVVLEAVRGVRDHKMAFYDAQVWAVAKLAQIPIVLSEDFDAGSVLEFLDDDKQKPCRVAPRVFPGEGLENARGISVAVWQFATRKC